MSIEHYAVFRATPGSVADLASREVMEARRAAIRSRKEFCEAIGAVALYGNDCSITAAIFAPGKALPVGWRASSITSPDGIVAIPDKKKKEGKNLVFTLREVPSLPGVESFTNKIGGSVKIIFAAGRHAMRSCYFERHGETLFVMSPFYPKGADEGTADENAPNDQVFTPEGCERVPLSVYYAAKEAAETEAAAAKVPKPEAAA